MAETEFTEMKEGEGAAGIKPGMSVIIVLHSPREKCWGLDLNAFDDWVRAVAHDEPFMGLSDLFFPMWRVERIARDESAGGVLSLTEQAEQRTGRGIRELLGN
jgi:hypothetical protein